MIVGIVGSEAAKFGKQSEQTAKSIIMELLNRPGVTGYSSGHCHLGGIDIWTEEIGNSLRLEPFVFPPRTRNWEGYKARNIQIAEKSDEVHCITLKVLPESYTGMRFLICYHCMTTDHVKSGGCWTMKYAEKLGKRTGLHVI